MISPADVVTDVCERNQMDEMEMGITKGIKQLIAEARDRIQTLTLDEAKAKLNGPNVTFIDIREPHELEADGAIPGAVHAPRGMLEFLADPASPYHKDVFSSGNELILYCASSGRSSLAAATLQDMGLSHVAHIDGGFKAWKQAGLPVEPLAKQK